MILINIFFLYCYLNTKGLKRGEQLRKKLEKQYELNLYRNRAIMNSIGGDILSLSMRDLIEKYDGDLSKYFLERAQNAINKKLPPLPQSLISFKRRREFINEAKNTTNSNN